MRLRRGCVVALGCLGLGLIVGGCVNTAGLRLSGDERSVTIKPTTDLAVAGPIAAEHCAAYGRLAAFAGQDGFRTTYRCVGVLPR